MTKTEFLKKLSRELSTLKRDERKKSLLYYDEFIDDSIESGLTGNCTNAECCHCCRGNS